MTQIINLNKIQNKWIYCKTEKKGQKLFAFLRNIGVIIGEFWPTNGFYKINSNGKLDWLETNMPKPNNAITLKKLKDIYYTLPEEWYVDVSKPNKNLDKFKVWFDAKENAEHQYTLNFYGSKRDNFSCIDVKPSTLITLSFWYKCIKKNNHEINLDRLHFQAVEIVSEYHFQAVMDFMLKIANDEHDVLNSTKPDKGYLFICDENTIQFHDDAESVKSIVSLAQLARLYYKLPNLWYIDSREKDSYTKKLEDLWRERSGNEVFAGFKTGFYTVEPSRELLNGYLGHCVRRATYQKVSHEFAYKCLILE